MTEVCSDLIMTWADEAAGTLGDACADAFHQRLPMCLAFNLSFAEDIAFRSKMKIPGFLKLVSLCFSYLHV